MIEKAQAEAVAGGLLMTGHIVTTTSLTGTVTSGLTLGTTTASAPEAGEMTTGETVESGGNLINFHYNHHNQGFLDETVILLPLHGTTDLYRQSPHREKDLGIPLLEGHYQQRFGTSPVWCRRRERGG